MYLSNDNQTLNENVIVYLNYYKKIYFFAMHNVSTLDIVLQTIKILEALSNGGQTSW
jgi:hypothetical protein